MGRHPRRVVALVIAGLLATACGARVTDQQVQSLRGTSTGASAADTQTGGPTASAEQSVTPLPGASGDAAGPAAATPGVTTAAAAPADGNGGATDVGVTASTMTLGNVTTLSGPIPGLFAGAVVGTQAVIAYQNSLGGMFGRTFKLDARDDQFDTGQNRAQTEDLVNKVFAIVGSFSVFDDASIEAMDKAGIPDVSAGVSGARRRMANNFSPSSQKDGGAPLAPFNYYKGRFPEEIKAVGTLYGDVPASKAAQVAYKEAAASVGWNFLYDRGYAATETDFTADVVRMRQSGVKLVFLATSETKTLARITKAMKQQNFDVPIVTNAIGYEQQLVTLGGDSVEGMYATLVYTMFAGEDAGRTPEVKLMNQWMQKIKPGYSPDVYALLGWASGRLFFSALQKAGPRATRAQVNDALRKIGPFDSNGLLAPSNPGTKAPATCIVIVQLRHGHYERVDTPASGFRCDLGGYYTPPGG